MSAHEEHHSGELMGVIKKGNSMIILIIREGRGAQSAGNLLGLDRLGQSLVLDEQATLCISILTAGCRKAESKEKYFHASLDACLASFRVKF
jgi:hypothetical protein